MKKNKLIIGFMLVVVLIPLLPSYVTSDISLSDIFSFDNPLKSNDLPKTDPHDPGNSDSPIIFDGGDTPPP